MGGLFQTQILLKIADFIVIISKQQTSEIAVSDFLTAFAVYFP
jgi:hypothetical protein